MRSMAEHDDAENAAWAAPGVTLVQNDLVLEEDRKEWCVRLPILPEKMGSTFISE